MKKIKIFLGIVVICILLAGCQDGRKQTNNEEYYFFYNGHRVAPGCDADELACIFGEANRISSATSCAGEGVDELYVYSGFKIYARRENKKSTVVAIELTNDTVPTYEGVRIGECFEYVKEKYGDGKEKNGFVEYEGGGCILRFYLREGKISSIKYLENDG